MVKRLGYSDGLVLLRRSNRLLGAIVMIAGAVCCGLQPQLANAAAGGKVAILATSHPATIPLSGTNTEVLRLRVPAGKWVLYAKLWADSVAGSSGNNTDVTCVLLVGALQLDTSGIAYPRTLGNTSAGLVFLTAARSFGSAVTAAVRCLDQDSHAQIHDANLSAIGVPKGASGTRTTIRSSAAADRVGVSSWTNIASLKLPAGRWALHGKLSADNGTAQFLGLFCQLVGGNTTIDSSLVTVDRDSNGLAAEVIGLAGMWVLPRPAIATIRCESTNGSGQHSVVHDVHMTAFGVPVSGPSTKTRVLSSRAAGGVLLAHPPSTSKIVTLTVPAGKWLVRAKLMGTATESVGVGQENVVVRCGLVDPLRTLDLGVFNLPNTYIGAAVMSLQAVTTYRQGGTLTLQCDDLNSNSQVSDAVLTAVGVT